VIQAVSRRLGGLGGMLVSIAGGATWAVVTYFMIPVLIYENDGAWASLKRSAGLFISTFGRSIISNLVVGLLIAAGIVIAVIVGVVGLVLIFSGYLLVGVVLLVVAFAVGAFFVLIGAAAEGILRAALYRYATTGKIEPELMPPGYRARATPPPPPPLAGSPLP
jgi:hypothetical protein